MSAELLVWIVSLGVVFLVGFAAGRASRRTVVVNFPEMPSMSRLKP
ncbi:MAG: hypothetical protein JWO98_4916, partial [Frankiales bacterium]|nr:hypothetical protein [Frankiales bacterium]